MYLIYLLYIIHLVRWTRWLQDTGCSSVCSLWHRERKKAWKSCLVWNECKWMSPTSSAGYPGQCQLDLYHRFPLILLLWWAWAFLLVSSYQREQQRHWDCTSGKGNRKELVSQYCSVLGFFFFYECWMELTYFYIIGFVIYFLVYLISDRLLMISVLFIDSASP